jgi:hypothetical protein
LSSNIAVTRSHKFLAAKNPNFVNVTQVVPNVSLATQFDSFFRSLKFTFFLQKNLAIFALSLYFMLMAFGCFRKFLFSREIFFFFFLQTQVSLDNLHLLKFFLFCFSFCFDYVFLLLFSFSLHICYCFWMIVAQLRTR